jgi:hypothetical protein
VAQSTPRIRLEPTSEGNGRKTLRHVPADSRSVFDIDNDSSSMVPSEMDIDSTPAKNQVIDKPLADHIPRKTSIRHIGLFERYSRKTKKHPSPSKAELEALENSLKESPVFGTSESLVVSKPPKIQDAVSNNVSIARVLGPKDPNTKVKAAAPSMDKNAGLGLFPKPASQPDLSRSGISMPNIKRKGQKSMIPRPTDLSTGRPRQEVEGSRYSLRDAGLNATAMDVDELQWNNTAYNIGR